MTWGWKNCSTIAQKLNIEAFSIGLVFSTLRPTLYLSRAMDVKSLCQCIYCALYAGKMPKSMSKSSKHCQQSWRYPGIHQYHPEWLLQATIIIKRFWSSLNNLIIGFVWEELIHCILVWRDLKVSLTDHLTNRPDNRHQGTKLRAECWDSLCLWTKYNRKRRLAVLAYL